MSLSLKLCFMGEVRRSTLHSVDQLSFDYLRQRAEACWPQQLAQMRERVQFRYVDDEDEVITVSGNEDVQEAVRTIVEMGRRSARFDVEQTAAHAAQAPQAPQSPRMGVPEAVPQYAHLFSEAMRAYGQFAPQVPQQTDLMLNALQAMTSSFQQLNTTPASTPTARSDASAQASLGGRRQASEQVVHSNVRCDNCDQFPIFGARYKCSVREDYDLCEACEAALDHEYPLLKIYKPEQAPAAIMCVLHPHQPAPATNAAGEPTQIEEVTWRAARRELRQRGGSRRSQRAASASEATQATPVPLASVSSEESEAKEQASVLTEDLHEPVVVAMPWMTSHGLSSRDTAAAPPSARFVRDITYPDGLGLRAGSKIAKSWELLNDGSTAWPEGTRLMFDSGVPMDGPHDGVPVRAAAPGELVEVQVQLTVPFTRGRYMSYWRLQTPSGEWFGHRLWANVIATEATMMEFRSSSPVFSQFSADRATSPVVVNSAATAPQERFKEELDIVTAMGFNASDVVPLLEGHIKHPASETGNVNMAEVQQLLQAMLDLENFRFPTFSARL